MDVCRRLHKLTLTSSVYEGVPYQLTVQGFGLAPLHLPFVPPAHEDAELGQLAVTAALPHAPLICLRIVHAPAATTAPPLPFESATVNLWCGSRHVAGVALAAVKRQPKDGWRSVVGVRIERDDPSVRLVRLDLRDRLEEMAIAASPKTKFEAQLVSNSGRALTLASRAPAGLVSVRGWTTLVLGAR